MMNANEMRAITDNVIEERLAATNAKTERFIEQIVAPQVEKRAQSGYGNAGVEIEVGINSAYLKQILNDLGYGVHIHQRYMSITW